MIAIAIDLGPPSGSRLRYGVGARNGDRLVMRGRPTPGCALIGLMLLAAASLALLVLLTDSPVCGSIGFGLLSVLGWLAFIRRVDVLDRRRGTLTRYYGLFLNIRANTWSLSDFTRVVLAKKNRVSSSSSGRTSVTTTFTVSLTGTGEPVEIDEPGEWEAAVPSAEVLARFLRLPMEDAYQEQTRQPEELDLPIAAQEVVSVPPAPEKPFCRVTEGSDGGLRIRIPRPIKQSVPLLGILVLLFIFWTLPVSFFGNLIFGLLPLALVFPGWVKAALGYSADIEVMPSGLRVHTQGLLFGRRVTFAVSELEHIIIHTLESGGPREMLSMVFGQILIARSDRASVRFGYGLEKPELVWLRARILAVLQSNREALAQKAVVEEKIPVLTSRWLAPTGFVVGALLGHFVGGPWAVSVAAPFLEHVLNAGAAIGVLLGHAMDELFATRPRPLSRTLLVALLWVAGTYALLHGYTPVVQRGVSFDEWRLVEQSGKTTAFWIGWLPVGAFVSLVFGNAVAWLLTGVFRLVVPKRWRERKPAEPQTQQRAFTGARKGGRIAVGCALIFVALFSLPCWSEAWGNWGRGRVGVAFGQVLLGLALHLPWIIALNLRRIKAWLTGEQWQGLGQLGLPWLVSVAGLAPLVAAAFDADEESFPSGRWAAAIAGGAFLGVAVGLMHQFASQVHTRSRGVLSKLALADAWLFVSTLLVLSVSCVRSLLSGNADALPSTVVLASFALVSLSLAIRMTRRRRADG